MARIAIVSTSINAEPKAYEVWAAASDATLIVAGDVNSPPLLGEYVSRIGGVYLSPSHQRENFRWSEVLDWKCVQRRNAAIMYALRTKFDYILTVDDDNEPAVPVDEFIAGHIAAIEGERSARVIKGAASDFVNTGTLCVPQFHQRGVPYGVDTTPMFDVDTQLRRPGIAVSQAQVLGDPDCDAVERMCNAPVVRAVNVEAVVKPGQMAAFNSQATMWTREWAPVMACLPGIGRYDDIFASYLFARLGRTYDRAVFVGSPCVAQVRNDHDLVKDLRAELWGMNNVFTFVSALQNAQLGSDMPLAMAYDELIIATSSILPRQTQRFAHAWVRDWREL